MRSMVEGPTRSATKAYQSVGNSSSIPQHFFRRNPPLLKAQRSQILGSPLIPGRPIAHVVRRSIDFDHELGGRAIEVGDIWPDRVLATKSYAARRSSKQAPKQRLGERHFAAEPA